MKISDIIAAIALIASFIVPIYILSYDKYSDEIMPTQTRSVSTGFSDTIYFSRFKQPHNIVVDLCNRSKSAMTNPEFDMMSDSLKQAIVLEAAVQAITRKSTLFVLNSQKQITDSIYINCFDCITVGITVPANGYLVYKCVEGCLNNFCSYEFINL